MEEKLESAVEEHRVRVEMAMAAAMDVLEEAGITTCVVIASEDVYQDQKPEFFMVRGGSTVATCGLVHQAVAHVDELNRMAVRASAYDPREMSKERP